MPLANKKAMSGDRSFVYVLRSADHDSHFYIGVTSDVDARLGSHIMQVLSIRPPLADRGAVDVVIKFA